MVGTAALLPRITGWARLEELFPDSGDKSVQSLHFQGFYIGKQKLGVSYRGCVTFEVCKSGLRVKVWKLIAPFSQPIFIPWGAIETEATRVFTLSALRMKIGPGGEYWMTLAGGTARRIAKASEGALSLPEA